MQKVQDLIFAIINLNICLISFSAFPCGTDFIASLFLFSLPYLGCKMF